MDAARGNDVELRYMDQSPAMGPAVIFGSSLGTGLRVWDGLLPHLPAGVRVLRYDKRGHGPSEAAPGPYSSDRLADDVAAFRDSGRAAPWQRMLERQPPEGYVACCEAIAAADLRAETARLDLPLHLIAGGPDGATPSPRRARHGRSHPERAPRLIAEAAHVPCVETPVQHAGIINGFLERIGHV